MVYFMSFNMIDCEFDDKSFLVNQIFCFVNQFFYHSHEKNFKYRATIKGIFVWIEISGEWQEIPKGKLFPWIKQPNPPSFSAQ